MYKLLIVDDNPWERDGISKVLDWKNMGIEVIGCCANGKQAYEKVLELKPDIVLTDIAMPIMNGIELAMAIKKDMLKVKVIFMSSHNEFEFAKSAIDLDIYGYVLKPIISEELAQVVSKVIDAYSEEHDLQREKLEMKRQLNESLPLLQEQFLMELLFGIYIDREDIKKRIQYLKFQQVEDYRVSVISVEINDYENLIMKDKNIEEKYFFVYSLKQLINSYNTENFKIYTVQTSVKEFCAVLFYTIPINSEESTDILGIAVNIREGISQKLGISTVLGISNSSSDIIDMPTLYQQSFKAINTKFYGNGTQIIRYNEIEIVQDDLFEGKIDFQALYKEVKELITFGNESEIKDFVVKYLGSEAAFYKESYIKGVTFLLINSVQLNLVEANESFKNIFGEELIVWQKLSRFETIKDVRQWLVNILKTINGYLVKKHLSLHSQVVQNIKDIIENRYHEQLTIREIAESIFFSAIHANNVFKKEMGKTIFDYLVEYRIEKAKQFLKDPNSRVYLVAENIGYTNKSHFCYTFKKFTGLSPAEYKNRMNDKIGGKKE